MALKNCKRYTIFHNCRIIIRIETNKDKYRYDSWGLQSLLGFPNVFWGRSLGSDDKKCQVFWGLSLGFGKNVYIMVQG